MHGNPDVGRIAAQCLAEKSRRSYADHGECMSFYNETRAHHRRIRSIFRLPCLMAQDRNRWSRGFVVIRRKQAAPERLHAKRGEIVARYVLRAQRFSGESAALTPNTQTLTARLKCSHFFEFRCLCFQPFVERKREHPPSVLRAALHAAIVAVANTIQKRRIRNRQRTQHDRVDHCENCSGSSNSQGQRQCSGRREHRRHPKLP